MLIPNAAQKCSFQMLLKMLIPNWHKKKRFEKTFICFFLHQLAMRILDEDLQ